MVAQRKIDFTATHVEPLAAEPTQQPLGGTVGEMQSAIERRLAVPAGVQQWQYQHIPAPVVDAGIVVPLVRSTLLGMGVGGVVIAAMFAATM